MSLLDDLDAVCERRNEGKHWELWVNNDWKKCNSTGAGCGLMHGCPDRHCEASKPDCKECIKDADEAMAQASGPLD
jgi:hypothetical protein